jgi:hypothetical protein
MSETPHLIEVLDVVLNSQASEEAKRQAVRRVLAQLKGQPTSPVIDRWLSEQARAFGVSA